MTKPKEAEKKVFNLKQSEANLIQYVQARSNEILIGVLTVIASDRFSYPVTNRTQFRITENNELELSELPEEEPKKEESPVKTAK